MNKDQGVAVEVERLQGLFSGNSDTEKAYIEKQVNQLAWYNVSISDLQMAIDRDGSMVEYPISATLTGTRRNPDIETLVAYQKLATGIAKNLARYLKKDEAKGGKLAEYLLA